MIEYQLEQIALLRFLRAQGLDHPRHGPDLGYGVHAWLKAAFGDLAPRTWRLLADPHRPTRLLGYTAATVEMLCDHLREFADPSVFAVCPPDAIAGKPMPRWKSGRRLGFEVLCCPVGRKARTRIEKDLFLIHADRDVGRELDRAAIYCEWLRPRLEYGEASRIERLWLEGFRRVHQQRKHQREVGKRSIRSLERPEAIMAGVLRIEKAGSFADLIAKGIGRHRAFGYGMLLVKPVAA